MTRLRIVHRTGFQYASPATASYNEARMLPRTQDRQLVLQARVETSPATHPSTYNDHWGTPVTAFEVLTPHEELSVVATSVVETRTVPARGPELRWDQLARAAASSLDVAEMLIQTHATDPDEQMSELANQARAEHDGIDAAATAICRIVGEAMTYRRGVTGVNSTARDAWPARAGVCQDIAHVTLGMLRAAGIPARYVSGYLHPDADPKVGETVTGESHAWVEWFSGAWRGYDPTNLVEIGPSHVFVGVGRDYADISPLRGVYAGSGASELFVSVDITRLE
ncbi:putative Transglutaminase-like enzyme, cysteine protease [Microbacterium sp. 8M]|jgi:transglutaminase-like putative cysteine protease|uniref:transglutaminase family protein n=1 Tax=Microbacterium sp. 8M TaxID=2653153 RepID=UPI0012F0A758|nr:transglutaminase family protein [Microbacterium sp. 8M]VXB34761.1 putative Transglutaminase-like enzyme, cysteine protease [Microbacterium sp. 8M]